MATENVNNPTSSNENVIAAPDALNNFFSTIPAKGNVTETEEEKKAKEVKEVEVEKEKEIEEEDDKLPEETTPPTPPAKAKTAEAKKEKEEEEEENEEDSIIHTLASVIGEEFELEGEFEDSEEGVKEVTKQIVNKSKELGRKEGVEILYAKTPLLKDVAEHLEKGGSLISLIQNKQIEDFAKIEIKEEDVEAQEKMFRTALDVRGLDKDSIEDLVNAAKNSGALFTRSQQSKDFLVDKQKGIIDAQIKQEQDIRAAELKESKETEDNIRGILATGKIHGMDISSDVAKRLEDFGLKQDAKGKTARESKWDSLTPEQWLTLDLIVMEDFKPVTNGKVVTPKSKPMKFKVKKAASTINLSSESTGGKITKTGVDATLNKLGITDVRDLFGGK